MNFINNIAALVLIVGLFLAGLDVSFAENALRLIAQSNKLQLAVSISLGMFALNLLVLIRRIAELEVGISARDEQNDSSVTLTDAEKENISIAVTDACKDSPTLGNLDNLIGLDSVKSDVRQLSHFIAAQEKRAVVGLPKQKISLHLVFTGNPGTGKTIVAREIAKIYKSYGLLEKGHLVETDRSGLVSEYVGQTAIKTKDKIAEAMGGVLFIDEAYSLLDGGTSSGNFGKEAIDTILKEMEDKRDKFVVIVAGYKHEMDTFISSNPGLKSRFSKVIEFKDYSAEELLQIFELSAKKDGYVLSNDVRLWMARWMIQEAPLGQKGFGNGRFVRNLFEKTVVSQAQRISATNLQEKSDLQVISVEDVRRAVANL